MEIQNAVIPENVKQPMEDAKIALNEMLGKMGVKVSKLNAWWDAKQNRILLTFDCDYPALVIGKEAKTLQSLQYLITLMISRNFNAPISVVADTQNYWNKLEEKINKDISYALMTIRRNKRPFRFRPMSAQMRRYIHHYLATEQDITTVSEGEGKWRKVVIKIARPEDKITTTASELPVEQSIQEENADCVLTSESTNCPAENLAETTPETPQENISAEVKTEMITEVQSEMNARQEPKAEPQQDNITSADIIK